MAADATGHGGAVGHPVHTGSLEVPGASLYYEVRGAGPVLLMIPGGPTDADVFAAIAPVLADRYAVVTYDPRGLSRSSVHDPGGEEPLTPRMQAEDAHHLLSAVSAEPAYVLGSSGGALTGLDLAAMYPGQVRVLVAHEPPVTELLPDREHHRAVAEEVYETYQKEGVGPAMAKFTESAGLEDSEAAAPPQGEPTPEMLEGMARMQANMEFFLARMWRGLIGYVPDAARLRAASTRVVVAVGEASGDQLARRAATAVAERLDVQPVVFPGDHGGYMFQAVPFADKLHEVLRGA